MLNAFGWIKNQLLKYWVNPSDLQNVDFNDPASLNELAQKIMPGLLKWNPQVVEQIKQVAPNLVPDQAKDIVDIIW